MIAATNWRGLRNRAGSLCLLAAVACVAAADCTQRTLQWQTGQLTSRSDWHERDSTGRQLVHENGLLHGAELAAALQCTDWQFSATLAQLRGTRWYDGQTSTGVPAISTSQVRRVDGHLQAGLNVTAEWQLLGRVTQVTLLRDVASVASASGFAERFHWTLLALGTQWSSAAAPGQLSLSAWLGTAIRPRMTMDLPGRDQTALQLGAIHQFDLGAGWRAPLAPGWHWQAGLRYRRAEMRQGEPAVITRSGTPVGVAYQPAASLLERVAMIGIGYDF